jgi:phage terminase large subunit
MIAEKLKPILGREPIFCDSAEPKSIAELQADGIDARPVKKGKDSVLHGIKWIQKHEVIVDEELQPVINELNTYQWKKDKDGNALPIPCGDDHFLDAARYALEVEHTGFFEGMV